LNNTILTGLPNFPTVPTSPTAPTGPEGDGGGGFGSLLNQAIDQVGQLKNTSDRQVSELMQGDRQDIHNVMIAVEKADVAFQLMMQVRNKIVNAYQEVSKLQF
jgi:flagellar hook-basal body complex protein FliE